MTVIETQRLTLREIRADDAAFILELVNDPAWLRFIGDKKVKTLEEARGYIERGPRALYARHGFGLWLVEVKAEGVPAGICGLVKRETLADVDIGFAFLPRHRARGYAREAAEATLDYARRVLGLTRIVAIASPDNERSSRLLEKIGLRFEHKLRLAVDADEVALFATP